MKKNVLTTHCKTNKKSFFYCVHEEKCDKKPWKWDGVILSPNILAHFFRNIFLLKINWVFDNKGWVFQAAFCNLPMFIWNGCALQIVYKSQNYQHYLGFRNIYFLSTCDQDISLKWEYYPEQCPILLSTVHWDTGLGYKINV